MQVSPQVLVHWCQSNGQCKCLSVLAAAEHDGNGLTYVYTKLALSTLWTLKDSTCGLPGLNSQHKLQLVLYTHTQCRTVGCVHAGQSIPTPQRSSQQLSDPHRSSLPMPHPHAAMPDMPDYEQVSALHDYRHKQPPQIPHYSGLAQV